MLFKWDICKDKSWVLHIPTTLANHSFGKQLVQESYLIFHHRPLCNGTSFNPLLCTGFKVLSVKEAVQKTWPLCRQRVCGFYRLGWVIKWLEEHFDILCLAHIILLMNIGLLPKTINLNLWPFSRQWKSNSLSSKMKISLLTLNSSQAKRVEKEMRRRLYKSLNAINSVSSPKTEGRSQFI